MAHDYHDLKKALATVAKRAESNNVFEGNVELQDANKAAVALFTADAPVLRRENPEGRLKNITALALMKVDTYLRKHGLDWPLFAWDDLLDWLYKNWFKIVRVLLSLLVLVL